MAIADDNVALAYLSNKNYYRFSGYTYLRLDRSRNVFRNGTTFDGIVALVSFDEKLRCLLFPLVESIEIALRCQIAYCFSSTHFDKDKYPQNDAHYDVRNFSDLCGHNNVFNEYLVKQMNRYKSELYVEKHIKSYNGRMPLWVLVELLSFTELHYLYNILLASDQKAIAQHFGHKHFYFDKWLDTAVVLRNKCAHHGRLYGADFNPPVTLNQRFMQDNPAIRQTHLFAAVYVTLLIAPPSFDKSKFITDLRDLLHKYEKYIKMDELHFPKNWSTVLNNIK